MIIAFGNLRGVKESGRVFAVPTFFFMFMMVVLLGYGFFEMINGNLPTASLTTKGLEEFGDAGDGIFYGRVAVRGAARVRVRWRRGDRRRGDLERRARVQEAGVEERPPDARHHGQRRSA